MKLPENSTRDFVRSGANNVRYSWNKVVKDFLANDSEWLFSTHNDVVFEPDTLLRLLSWDKPLVSALIFMRNSPVTPHAWNSYQRSPEYIDRIEDTRNWFFEHRDYIKFGPFVMDPRPNDALKEIAFTSTSCTLIHRSVLEGMRETVKDLWFEWDDDYNGGGEDRRFFENAKNCGFQPYIDMSCVVGHLVGDIPTSAADFIAWDSVSSFRWNGNEQ